MAGLSQSTIPPLIHHSSYDPKDAAEFLYGATVPVLKKPATDSGKEGNRM